MNDSCLIDDEENEPMKPLHDWISQDSFTNRTRIGFRCCLSKIY